MANGKKVINSGKAPKEECLIILGGDVAKCRGVKCGV
jgi:hypothetical protein